MGQVKEKNTPSHYLLGFLLFFFVSRNAIGWHCCVHKTICPGDPEEIQAFNSQQQWIFSTCTSETSSDHILTDFTVEKATH